MLSISSATADEPIEVGARLKIQQITGINQREENFGIVGTLIMQWHDPELAAKPGETVAPRRMFPHLTFVNYMMERGLIWPAYSFYNVQGRVTYQNRLVVIDVNGNVDYIARFTAKFQAPDFDFRHFPLDEQDFYIKLDLLPRVSRFVLTALPGSGIGDALGEEEWILEHTETRVTTHDELGHTASRFVLSFQGERHLNYYLVRMLIPATIIILVSWFTFFLKDYTKRIDLASGNLLLFIAFNFTVANDLPRLGYLTLMDTFMLSTFAITGLVVLVNVWLRRLQNHGKEVLANKLDEFSVWGYPLTFAAAGLSIFIFFY
ncbi:MAG: electron transporter RnfC [Gammaproteobacteria bacterium]|nr:MAG: electron transporter RnfC [Gammaproteobacteria bacterium]RLA52262.1 MAG: electron transporter RnfC [Gammaproteobacteria bacterium]